MKFYRYEARVYAVLDMDGEYVSPDIPIPKIEVREFELIRETPKGYWIGSRGWNGGEWWFRKWVSKTAKKRFAYPTKAEALQNYIKRTERRVYILKKQLEVSQYGLSIAKAMQKSETIKS